MAKKQYKRRTKGKNSQVSNLGTEWSSVTGALQIKTFDKFMLGSIAVVILFLFRAIWLTKPKDAGLMNFQFWESFGDFLSNIF